MGARWPWIERRFSFDFPIGKFPDVLERYRGTPVRLEERVRGAASAALAWHDRPGTWSVLENIGHLLDLEPLWEGRLDDFLAGRPVLRAADMSNRATAEAGHNARQPAEILGDFRAARESIVARLEGLADSDWARVSVHPRLNQPMRLVDAIAFTSDHDDYHMARIGELLRTAPGSGAGAGRR